MEIEAVREKVKAVPKLRFAGFNDEWPIVPMETIADIERGRFSPRPRNNPRFYGGAIPFVQTNDVVNCDGIIEQYSQTLNEEGLAVSKLFPAGTILMTIAANIGHTGVLQVDMACPDSLVGIKCKPDYHNYFLNHFLSTQQTTLEYLAPEGAQKNINLEVLRPFRVPNPTLPEQQKIAAFLGAVDRKIQQLKRKQELLERYKKGVVQQLFSQELRFKRKDGGEFPEWEEKSLGDIYTYHNTNSLSRDKLNYEGGDVLNIHYGDIHTKFAAIFKAENERVPYINDDVDLSRVSEDQYCQPCDLVIADASEDLNDIGKTIEIASTGGKRIVAGLHTYLARPKKGSMAPGYGAYLMRSVQVREEIERLAHGTKVMSISRTHLNSIEVTLPSLEEQTRIAGFLMALDAKVAGVGRAVAAAQRWKKGLLQQMFV